MAKLNFAIGTVGTKFRSVQNKNIPERKGANF